MKKIYPLEIAPWSYGLGILFLVIAAATAGMLVVQHFGAHLPGCGPQSDCAALEASVWGKIPAIGWPVSFVGLAYFFSLLAGWIATRRMTDGWMIWLIRAGVLGSLLFIVVMISMGKICAYCLGTHLANLAFWIVMELSIRKTPAVARASGQKAGAASKRSSARRPNAGRSNSTRVLTTGFTVFAAVSVLVGIADTRSQETRAESAESDRQESIEQIVGKIDDTAKTDDTTGTESADIWGPDGFTGRYRLGPEASPIRIVMLTDYQCPDCRRLEDEAMRLVEERDDLSLSIKHFPMCAEATPGVPCNKYVKRTLHANACWAARAAEAAGILAGSEGFFRMHRWLFARKGSFTDAELRAGLTELGFDPDAFLPVMSSPETLDRIRSDVEEGYALGLHYTPMIFINGVQLRGWQSPNAITRTIQQVVQSNPPPRKASADRPILAVQKFVQDWKEQPVRSLPADLRSWPTGANAEETQGKVVEVVIFGDYQEEFTARAHDQLIEAMRKVPNVRYTFRHYPIDRECNPTLPAQVRREAIHPGACWAARLAEAAGSIGGVEAYWKMHDWLMHNQNRFDEFRLRDAATELGMDEQGLRLDMQSADVTDAIEEDCRAASRIGLRAVPTVFVDGKQVPRLWREGENIFLLILEEAAKE